jgi:hypothetical protein
VGIGLDYPSILAPLAIYSFKVGTRTGNSGLPNYGIICVLGALFGLALFLWSVRIPMDNTIPMPALVRWSFAFVIIALLVVSTLLILQVPSILPWKMTPELSVPIGWMFMGAAAYFAYALIKPSWVNSAGQLAGFLAYDVVLIVPFLTRLPTIAPEHRTEMIVYLIVIIYSGLLAIYYLFVNRSTRIFRTAHDYGVSPG